MAARVITETRTAYMGRRADDSGRLRHAIVRRIIIAALAVLAASAAFPIFAQVIVEDDDAIVTNVVELFDTGIDDGKSIGAAMAMSFALPGSGHHYFDKKKSAYVYLSIDIASVFGAVLFNSLSNQRESEARSYARTMAGIERAPSGNAYWRHVGAYMDAAEYNEITALSRGDAGDPYADPEMWWRWADESQKDTYNDIRQKARDLRVVSSFFIGALVVNRIVSAVDLRVFRNKSMTSGVRFQPVMSPDLTGAGVTLQADF